MITHAARRLTSGEASAEGAAGRDAARPAPRPTPAALPRAERETSAWLDPVETLSLVRDGSRFEVMLGEAASWADAITLCVTAPQSALASAPWWGELLARASKCEHIYLRRADQADGGLLHRLHDTGALRLLEGGGKQVAGNLMLFAREGELRVLLSHIPFERAVSGAAFGALLSFRGRADGELARACRAQIESWAARARIPSGSDIDALAFDARRLEPLPAFTAPSSTRVISDPTELEAHLSRLVAESGDALSARPVEGAYRLQLRAPSDAHPPLVLTLQAGPTWAAASTLLLDAGDGRSLLVWRGGLLGPSRAKQDLLWSEARLHTLALEEALGPGQHVALIADSAAPLAPQLAAFTRELRRLGDVFEVPPPPPLADVLADFASLSPHQQTLLLWRALLGLGALELDVATLTAAQVLCAQGYLLAREAQRGHATLETIAQLLVIAAERGHTFDSPSASTLRAIQPDLTAYSEDDWLECLLRALPEGRVIARRNAQRLAFEHARQVWGLWGHGLERHGAVERALETTIASAIRRGLLARAGADAVRRLGPFLARPEPARLVNPPGGADDTFLGGWSHELERLPPLQRHLLTRRVGAYAARESQASVAQRLGISPERARQLEAETWRELATSAWAQTLRARLDAAFAGARALRVSRLAVDDAWWRDLEQHLDLAEALFENLLGAELHSIVPRHGGERWFARFPQAELDAAFADLLQRAAQLPTPAPLDDYRALATAAAQTLDPCLAEHLLEELQPHLELDADDPLRVARFLQTPAATAPPASEPTQNASEEHLRLEDTLRSVFRAAGTPLSSESVAERVRRRLDVDDPTLARLLARAPFVRRNADQYGLLSRDVPGGPEAIATALNTLTDALHTQQRALDTRDAFALVQAQIKPAWSLELLCSLIDSDPALNHSTAHAVTLEHWDAPPDTTPSTRLFPGMPARARSRLRELLQHPPTPPARLVQRLRGALAQLERAADDDLLRASLARQLCHLYERLLEHVAREPAHDQRLVPAAMEHLLETLTPKGDEEDDACVPRDTLTEARRTLAALLRHLELDWL